ncbi:MAG: hypothetical protein JNK05_11960 [Myxococcales bacterium]|nr:hypothetical protein [Myxococcales bacterium]
MRLVLDRWVFSSALALAACSVRGAVVRVGDAADAQTDSPTTVDVPIEDRPTIDSGVPMDVQARDAIDVTDASDVTDATDAGVISDARDVADVLDSATSPGCVTTPSGLTGLTFRGIAATSDRTAYARAMRLFYVDSRANLRSELRTPTLARECAIDLGTPAGVTLIGTPSAAHWREDVVVAGRTMGGEIQYWARFATGTASTCGQELGPWTLVPTVSGERWATAPAVRVLADFDLSPRIVVVGVTESGRVMFVDRYVDNNGPTGDFQSPQIVSSVETCDVVRTAPHVRQRGGNLGYVSTLGRDERGGYSYFSTTHILSTRAWWTGSLEQLYFGAELPPWRPSQHEWERPSAVTPFCEGVAWTRASAAWAYVRCILDTGEVLTYRSRSLGTPFGDLVGDVPYVVLMNGPGRAERWGREGALYAIAQSSVDPTRLRYIVQSSFEWFTMPSVVWLDSPDRLE